jgi:hypothetical protein
MSTAGRKFRSTAHTSAIVSRVTSDRVVAVLRKEAAGSLLAWFTKRSLEKAATAYRSSLGGFHRGRLRANKVLEQFEPHEAQEAARKT